MKKKLTIFYIVLALVALAGIVAGAFFLKNIFISNVYEERKTQLEELTSQMSSTFSNALKFNWACVNSAVNIAEGVSYESTDDVVAEIGWLDEKLDVESNDGFIVMIDEHGRAYDSEGEKGVWGDFDSIADDAEQHTFIADSATYSGVQWAFAQKLSTPIETGDGKATITHVVLMKTVSSLEKHYTSEAYKEVCETYLLNTNGTRMYDSATDDDIISAYNVYKYLRSCESVTGDSFDSFLDELDKEGVACSEYTINNSAYYISVAALSDFDTVLMFVIPENSVAENTLSMVSGIMKALVVGGLVIIVMVAIVIISMTRLQNAQQITKEREENFLQIEQINAKLEETNASLEKAKLASEDALVVAKAANSAKSSFLSNMSHDIRTPLNAIVGFTTLLKNNAGNEQKVLETAGKIDSASELLLRLINDVLDMSRIESGKTTLHTEIFSLDEMLNEVYNVILQQANQREQHFDVIKDYPNDITVQGDKLRLNQILMNLLSNSVKYTPKRGMIVLEVSLSEHQAGAAADVMFVVRDNGIGMTEEFLAHVFEPFTRAHESVTNTVQGTGLGLAITKSLVELLGGVISVTSTPGHGSTFTVDIPLQTVGEDDLPEADGSNAVEIPEDILQGKHFLVAEDNEINAEIIGELLKMEGATCDIAKNGEEAVAMFEKAPVGKYQAVLMDIQMPILDGYGATKKIRACSHAEALTMPIAAMTANAFTEDVSQAFMAGMNAHITKPVDMQKIKEFVANSLSNADNPNIPGGGIKNAAYRTRLRETFHRT